MKPGYVGEAVFKDFYHLTSINARLDEGANRVGKTKTRASHVHLGVWLVDRNAYAAKSYLDRMGRPKAPRDVAAYDFVGNADPERLMAPLHNMGIPVSAERFVMSSESGVVAWELVKAGYAVSMQPEVLGDAEPGIEKVLSDFLSLEFPIWLVTHRELQTGRRIRIVFDLLARGLLKAARKTR